MAKCFILESSTNFTIESSAFLQNLLTEKPDLCAVVGVDCENWAEALYLLCLERGHHPQTKCKITSHPDQTTAEVVSFVEQWCKQNGGDPEIKTLQLTLAAQAS